MLFCYLSKVAYTHFTVEHIIYLFKCLALGHRNNNSSYFVCPWMQGFKWATLSSPLFCILTSVLLSCCSPSTSLVWAISRLLLPQVVTEEQCMLQTKCEDEKLSDCTETKETIAVVIVSAAMLASLKMSFPILFAFLTFNQLFEGICDWFIINNIN